MRTRDAAALVTNRDERRAAPAGASAVRKGGLTPSQQRALSALEAAGDAGLSAREATKALHCKIGAAGEALRALLLAGKARRENGPGRRARFFFVTPNEGTR